MNICLLLCVCAYLRIHANERAPTNISLSCTATAAYWWPGQHWSQPATAFYVLGSIAFLPGAYAVYIAIRAYRGDPGYSFDMIPTIH